jgi:heat shock protein HslJ
MFVRVWGVAAVLLLCLSGCGDSDDDDSSAAPTAAGTELTPAQLDGTSYVATGITGRELVPGTELRIAFVDEHLSVRAGCNTLSAPYEVQGSTLRWTGPAASTMAACPDELQAQDQWLTDFFTNGAEITVDNVGGTLSDDEVTIDMIRDLAGDNA